MAGKNIQFHTLQGRLNYIKKKAQEYRASKVKRCHVCGNVSLYYAYITKGPRFGACKLHKDTLQPVLRKLISRIPDSEIIEEYNLDEVEEIA